MTRSKKPANPWCHIFVTSCKRNHNAHKMSTHQIKALYLDPSWFLYEIKCSGMQIM